MNTEWEEGRQTNRGRERERETAKEQNEKPIAIFFEFPLSATTN